MSRRARPQQIEPFTLPPGPNAAYDMEVTGVWRLLFRVADGWIHGPAVLDGDHVQLVDVGSTTMIDLGEHPRLPFDWAAIETADDVAGFVSTYGLRRGHVSVGMEALQEGRALSEPVDDYLAVRDELRPIVEMGILVRRSRHHDAEADQLLCERFPSFSWLDDERRDKRTCLAAIEDRAVVGPVNELMDTYGVKPWVHRRDGRLSLGWAGGRDLATYAIAHLAESLGGTWIQCANCGKRTLVDSPRAKYCSTRCRVAGNRRNA